VRPAEIARVCHEANRAVQIITGDPLPSDHWDDAEDWQRESAVEGVVKAMEGYTPEQLHESWCEFKIADGWGYGEVKDAVAKTHPCLVEYSALPADQQIKDHLFEAIVKVLA
jgi:hypothetical protein